MEVDKTNGSHLRQNRWLPDGWNWSATQLPFPIVSFNISFSAINHSEMTSDKNGFVGLLLADYCKALPSACNREIYFHNINV